MSGSTGILLLTVVVNIGSCITLFKQCKLDFEHVYVNVFCLEFYTLPDNK